MPQFCFHLRMYGATAADVHSEISDLVQKLSSADVKISKWFTFDANAPVFLKLMYFLRVVHRWRQIMEGKEDLQKHNCVWASRTLRTS